MFELSRVTNFWSNGNGNTPPKEAPVDLGFKLIFSLDVLMDNGMREYVFCALSEADKYKWVQHIERNLAGIGAAKKPAVSPRPMSVQLSSSPSPSARTSVVLSAAAPPAAESKSPALSRSSQPAPGARTSGVVPPQPAPRPISRKIETKASSPSAADLPPSFFPPPPPTVHVSQSAEEEWGRGRGLTDLELPPPPPLPQEEGEEERNRERGFTNFDLPEPPLPDEEENRLRGLTDLGIAPPPLHDISLSSSNLLSEAPDFVAPLPPARKK